MTDYELNIAISEKLGITNGDDGGYHQPKIMDLSKPELERLIDYCNNWNDLMPLVVKYSKDLDWESGEDFYHSMCDNKNTQRALAECLLKVLESKQ